ncbi:MAG: metallophosphoesterase family protein [Flavobacterium sp.]|nr:metallophosphoesterase family protein [Flavobacterium sp.]
MILTIFGDVHGNLIALEELFKAEKAQTDIFICHGDIVNYGPWTNECVQFLNEIPNLQILKGNHEQYFLDGFYDGQHIVAKSFFEFCYQRFDVSLLQVIRQYGDVLEAGNYTVKHTIGNGYIFADTDITNINIDRNYIIGHSHQQFERKKNDYKIFNTGSLGQNRAFINQSNYLTLDTDTGKVTLKSYLHDIDRVINKMKSDKYPTICTDYYLSKKRL